MVFGRKSRQGDKRPKSPEFDFLTTLFNLPNRLTLERDDRRRQLAQRQAQRQTQRQVVVSYASSDDDESAQEEDTEEESSSDSSGSSESTDSDEESQSESESESESESDSDEDPDEQSEDSDQSVAVHRIIVKRIPCRQRAKLASPKQRRLKVSAREHRKVERAKKVKPAPEPAPEKPVSRKVRCKKSAAKSPPVSPTRTAKSTRLFEKAPIKERIKKLSKERTREAAKEPIKKPSRAPTEEHNKPKQRTFIPEPVFGFIPPAVPQVQSSIPFQYHTTPHGYYQQPPSAYSYTPNVAQAPPYAFPVPAQQPDAFLPRQSGNAYATVDPHVPAQSGKSGPMGLAFEVQKIQSQIDKVVAQLSRQPNDKELKAKKKSLQNQLNSALDKATAPRTRPADTVPTFAHNRGPRQSRVTEIVERAPDDESIKDSSLARPSSLPSRDSVKTEEPQVTTYKRPVSPEIEKPLHRCWGCGFRRSLWYHNKYPFETTRRVKSLCESCRCDLYLKGVVGNRHYCSGCGRARSAQFHRQHPAKAGDPYLLNFCHFCEDDTETVDGTTVHAADDSVSHPS